ENDEENGYMYVYKNIDNKDNYDKVKKIIKKKTDVEDFRSQKSGKEKNPLRVEDRINILKFIKENCKNSESEFENNGPDAMFAGGPNNFKFLCGREKLKCPKWFL